MLLQTFHLCLPRVLSFQATLLRTLLEIAYCKSCLSCEYLMACLIVLISWVIKSNELIQDMYDSGSNRYSVVILFIVV